MNLLSLHVMHPSLELPVNRSLHHDLGPSVRLKSAKTSASPFFDMKRSSLRLLSSGRERMQGVTGAFRFMAASHLSTSRVGKKGKKSIKDHFMYTVSSI
jgi:hypothetical protein